MAASEADHNDSKNSTTDVAPESDQAIMKGEDHDVKMQQPVQMLRAKKLRKATRKSLLGTRMTQILPVREDEEMDRRLPYRRGLPLLKPLPLRAAMVTDDLALMGRDTQNELTTKIAGILRERHVYFHSACFARRYHADDTDRESEDVTFFIESDLEKSSIESWELAVRSIRELLDTTHLQQIWVEIIDFRSQARSSFAITKELFPSDQVESLYTSARLYLKALGMRWTTITLLNRGSNSSDLHPKFLVTALDAQNQKWWDEALPRLQQMCLDVSPKLEVELLQGAVSYAHGQDDMSLHSLDFGKTLQLGGSISAKGSTGSGSIGAAIKLRIGQDPPATFVLTNHHVTTQAKDSKSSQDHYSIRSPSDRDVLLYRDALMDDIATYKKERDYRAALHNAKAEMVQRMRSYIAVYEDKLSKIPADDNARHIGNLFASRQDLSGGWIVDWSLTRLDDDRSMINEVPQVIERATTSKTLQNANSSPTESITTWSDKMDFRGCRVVKRGRTTGWTVGIVNMYKTFVMDDAGQFAAHETNQNGKVLEGNAWPICSTALLHDVRPFMAEGDSGSIIIQTENNASTEGEVGTMIGLGFGVNHDFGLMSPLSAVFADIEEKVDGVIIEPRKL
ncbi:MAG: hypothetical protein Q9157_006309 [Trypethelium eluteriae]